LANTKAEPRRRDPVVCPSCESANSAVDQYCGLCGTPLSTLWWRPVGSEGWRRESGKLALAEIDPVAEIEYWVEGVVPRAFVVQDPEPEDGRRWIDDEPLRRGVYTSLPDEKPQTLNIPLHRDQLEELFEKERGERLEHRNELLATLPLLTSRGREVEGRFKTDRLEIELVVARKPWLEPEASLYRFLPVERLQNGGIRHLVTLHDEATAEPVTIEGYRLEDVQEEPPAGYRRLRADQLIEISRPPVRRTPEERPEQLLYLRAPKRTLPEDEAGWFSALLIYTLSQGSGTYEVSTRISGVVGRGPTLEVGEGRENLVSLQSPYRKHEEILPIVNPGALPVRLVGLQVQDPEGAAIEGRDWLLVDGLEQGEILGPGEVRELRLRFNRRARPPREMNEDYSFRKIILEHDGWPLESGERRLVLDIQVLFGTLDVQRILGIDFGTSSSVVCLMGARRGFPLELEKEGERPHALASLMYFDHTRSNEVGRDIFYFGETARRASQNMPANLVRSIKTIVAENAAARYLLITERRGSNILFEWRTAQELLNRFITELVELSEEGASYLGPEELTEVGLRGEHLSFRNAVFSHPVDVTPSMQEALLQAAHASYLNEPLKEVPQFFAESCVDEATAAVLAYVHGRLFAGVAPKYPRQDRENIVCFDMGGGTTDLAAVEVEGMAVLLEGTVDEVTVRPVAQGGERDLGGDLLDRRIAGHLLKQVQEKSEAKDVPIDIRELRHAIRARSFTNFQIGYRDRAGRKKGNLTSEESRAFETEAETLFNLAAELLGAAESLKRDLSTGDEASCSIGSAAWPYKKASPQNAHQSFDLVLDREQLTEVVGKELKGRLRFLDTLVARAGWQWGEVTTLLFTGQSVRSPVVRDLVIEYLRQYFDPDDFERLLIIHPGTGADEEGRGGFDPKLCVAIGAAIWGISRQSPDPWLRIDPRRVGESMPFDLTTGAPLYRPVQGLEHGANLPARAPLSWGSPRSHLELFKDRKPYVRFHFDPGRELLIEVESPTEIFLTVDGKTDNKIPGKILR